MATNNDTICGSEEALLPAEAVREGGPISTLRFDVSFTVVDQKKNKKLILDAVHGVSKTGETLAILGPSGAGKTTLLKVLTLDAFGGHATGTVMLNGENITSEAFKKRCALVAQEDFHWAFLTCRESLEYAAVLTSAAPAEERSKQVDRMMKKMGLEVCADTRVGNAFMQGLSGGQKRRLSIGIALLKKPEVLYLDEPTSGLDAASASAIMNFITDITRKERLMTVCTIHQPSSLIYQQFDSLLLLSRGRVAYFGPRAGVEAHLSSINFPLPPATNPAEFLLDLVNPDFADEAKVKAILDMWGEASPESGLRKRISSLQFQSADRLAACATLAAPVGGSAGSTAGSSAGSIAGSSAAPLLARPGLLRQIQIMFSRHALITARDPSLYTGRMLIFVVCTIFFSIIYIEARVRTQSVLLSRMWFILWCHGVPANMGVVATFVYNFEFNAVRREVMNGMLDPTAYLVANTIIQVPMMFMFGLASLGLAAYCIMNYNPDKFGELLVIYALTMYAWESVAQMLSVAFDNPLLGMLQYVQLWFASFMFCGIFLPIDQIVWPFRIFSYVLPYRYAFRSTVHGEFIDNPEGLYAGVQECDPLADARCNFVQGRMGPQDGWKCGDGSGGLYNCYGAHGWQVLETVRTTFGIFSSVDYFRQDCGTLIGIAMGFKVLYLVLMVVKCNRVSRLAPPKEEEAEAEAEEDAEEGWDKAGADALLVVQDEGQVWVLAAGEEGAGDVEMTGISI